MKPPAGTPRWRRVASNAARGLGMAMLAWDAFVFGSYLAATSATHPLYATPAAWAEVENRAGVTA